MGFVLLPCVLGVSEHMCSSFSSHILNLAVFHTLEERNDLFNGFHSEQTQASRATPTPHCGGTSGLKTCSVKTGAVIFYSARAHIL